MLLLERRQGGSQGSLGEERQLTAHILDRRPARQIATRDPEHLATLPDAKRRGRIVRGVDGAQRLVGQPLPGSGLLQRGGVAEHVGLPRMPGKEGAERGRKAQHGGEPLEEGAGRNASGHRDPAAELRRGEIGIGRFRARRDHAPERLSVERAGREMTRRVLRAQESRARERVR